MGEHASCLLEGSFPPPREALERASRAASPLGSEVQLVRVEAVVSPRHVASAAEHALRAFKERRNRAQGLGLEFLRYLTGERQIARALEIAGLPEGARQAAGVALGARPREALVAAAQALGVSLSWLPAQGGPPWAQPGGPALADDAERWALERVALLDLKR